MRRIALPRLVFSRRPSGAAEDATAERFRSAILPHLDAAYSYARYLCRDPGIAEDIVQDAFLRAHRNIGQCRGNEKAWLLAIVRNCHFDWHRANGREAIPVADTSDAAELATPHTLLETKSEVEHLRAVLKGLPEPFREALILRELEELSYREIAELTRAPIGTVMSRLARARAMLSALMLDRDSAGLKVAER